MAELAAALRQRTDPADRVGHAALAIGFLVLVLFLAAPLAAVLVQSVEDRSGGLVALQNFAAYLKTPALAQSLWNSLWVALVVTLAADIALIPAFGVSGAAAASSIAYGVHFAGALFAYQRISGRPALDAVLPRLDDAQLYGDALRSVRDRLRQSPATDVR